MTNNNKTMNITDYLKSKNIKFIYIQLDYTNKPKNPLITKPNVSEDNMFYYEGVKGNNMNNSPNEIFNSPNCDKLIAENHRLYSNNNAIAIDTQNIIWLDIDIVDKTMYDKLTAIGKTLYLDLKKHFPYHKSNTKEMGFHNILCDKTEKKLSKKIQEVFKNFTSGEISDINNFNNSADKDLFTKINAEYGFVEIMCGKPLWCLKDKIMENCSKRLGGQKSQQILSPLLHNKFVEKYRDRTEAEKKEEIELQEKKKKQEQQKKQLEEIKIDNNYIEDKQDLILQLTKLINKDLYLEVSSTFHNIVWSLSYNNCNTSLTYIKEIGKQSSKCDNKIPYEEYFSKLVEKGKTTYQLNIGVIYNLARQSNNKKYIELLGNNNSSVSNITLAELFMKSYEGDIILLRLEPDSPQTTWFYNKDKNSWSCETNCEYRTLTTKINKFCIQYIQQLQETDEEIDYSKTLAKFMDSLEQSIKIKNFILGELIEEPKNIEFDNKPHLIPFKNTIFNTKTCKMEDHRRDNYITLTLDYDFRTIKETEEEYINAKNYFEELFLWKENGKIIEEHSHKDIMEDVLFIIANCFVGRDKGEHFFIFNGKGGNGKSKLFDLLRMILDKNKYYGGVNGNLICADIDPNKPSPDIANLQNKRVNVLQEPSENKLLNISAIKYLTGEEYIRARKLFKNPVDFVLNATNILVCNQRLGFEGQVNNAIIRRIIDIHLPFVFSNSKINKDKKIYKPKTVLNLEDIKMGFINYVLDYITNFEKREIIENKGQKNEKKYTIGKYAKNINYIDFEFSKPTMERTKNYLLEYDYLGQFLDRYIVRTDAVSQEIRITDIHKDFKKSKWYKDLDEKKQKYFDSADKFKKNILAVEEYNDIQYDDTKNKKGWKFVYCKKNPNYDITEDTETEPDPQELIDSDNEDNNSTTTTNSYTNYNNINYDYESD
jgi:hypothetical protein